MKFNGKEIDLEPLRDPPIGIFRQFEKEGLLDKSGSLDIFGIDKGLRALRIMLKFLRVEMSDDELDWVPNREIEEVLPQIFEAFNADKRDPSQLRPMNGASSTVSTSSGEPTAGQEMTAPV